MINKNKPLYKYFYSNRNDSEIFLNELNALSLVQKAFQSRKPKLATLMYALQQIKPILKEYMKKNGILKLEIDLETRHVLSLEPISRGEREMWVKMWLNSEISTQKFAKKMREHYQWVEYVSFTDFLSSIESWLKESDRSE